MSDANSRTTDGPKLPKKILFLDVDGVLNTTASKALLGLSKRPLRELSRIVEATGCSIVLSSTWRRAEFAKRHLLRALGYRGIKIFSYTPTLQKDAATRGEEIDAWWEWYGGTGTFRYAIIDDDADMLLHQYPNYFRTLDTTGLTSHIADAVIAHLNHGDVDGPEGISGEG